MNFKVDNRSEEDQTVLKLLIPEKHLQKGKTPRERHSRLDESQPGTTTGKSTETQLKFRSQND